MLKKLSLLLAVVIFLNGCSTVRLNYRQGAASASDKAIEAEMWQGIGLSLLILTGVMSLIVIAHKTGDKTDKKTVSAGDSQGQDARRE